MEAETHVLRQALVCVGRARNILRKTSVEVAAVRVELTEATAALTAALEALEDEG